MDDVGVRVSESDGLGFITIDRPDARNALSRAMIGRMREAVDDWQSSAVGAIVISAAGDRVFSAGADLRETRAANPSEFEGLILEGQAAFRAIERSQVPTIAAVNGVALGGGFELALACSMVVASVNASFGLPEATLGLIPGFGGTQRLTRIVGRNVARFVMLAAERLDAHRAYQLGISVLPPVSHDELAEVAVGLARKAANGGPEATRAILRLTDPDLDGRFDPLLAVETDAALAAARREESVEGIGAFLERRSPRFREARSS